MDDNYKKRLQARFNIESVVKLKETNIIDKDEARIMLGIDDVLKILKEKNEKK